ncbi:UNVERIFIED_CONTAM: hypothetical protein K2H54_033660 [Gekko kuhli]
MVPNEVTQYMAVIQLLHHFKWTWIVLIAADDDNGDTFLKNLMPMLSENGICVNFTVQLAKQTYLQDRVEVFAKQREYFSVYIQTKANVWIITCQWDFESISIQRVWDIEAFHGAISFAVHSNEPPGFQTFLQSLSPSWAKGDGFIQNFWEQAFSCSLGNPNVHGDNKEKCTGEEKLDTIPETLFEMSMTGHSYNVYNAVYAAAHVLHAIYVFRNGHRRTEEERSLELQNVQSWEVIASQRHCANFIAVGLHSFIH